MSENVIVEKTPGQKRIAAAHEALAKKRAENALKKLIIQQAEIDKKLAEPIIPPPPPPPPSIQEEVKETMELEKKQEETNNVTDKEEKEKEGEEEMSSSEEIIIEKLKDETKRSKPPKKQKLKAKEADGNIPRTPLNRRTSETTKGGLADKYANSYSPRSSGRSEEEEYGGKSKRAAKRARSDESAEEEPTKKRKNLGNNGQEVVNVNETKSNIMGRVSNAINGIRNINIPPVVSNVVSNSATTIGWSVAIFAMAFFKAYIQTRASTLSEHPRQYSNYHQPQNQFQPTPIPPSQTFQSHTPTKNNYNPYADYPGAPHNARNYPTNSRTQPGGQPSTGFCLSR